MDASDFALVRGSDEVINEMAACRQACTFSVQAIYTNGKYQRT